MPLTDDEIAAIARWEPVHAGYGRDDDQTGIRIRGIADRINSSKGIQCQIVADDGLSNYFVLFSFVAGDAPSFALERSTDGLLIYLSACAPVGVVGRSQRFVGTRSSSHKPLTIETLFFPDYLGGRLEDLTFDAIRSGGYEILSAPEVSRKLPAGVEPFEYCLCPEPWDRVFHALFRNTD